MVDMSALIGKHLGDRKIAGSMDFADMLLENANVALTPGTAFCAEGYCRISYATSMEPVSYTHLLNHRALRGVVEPGDLSAEHDHVGVFRLRAGQRVIIRRAVARCV